MLAGREVDIKPLRGSRTFQKGPHILRAVQTLDDILQRMEAHQLKKQSMMRELSLARTFMNVLPGPGLIPHNKAAHASLGQAAES